MPSRSAFASPWFPELSHRAVAGGLLALGVAGLAVELASGVFVPRLVLFLIVLGFGAVGRVRGRPVAARV